MLWIEKEPGPDIAFIQLESENSASGPPAIQLAGEDAKPGDGVVVIGYPAKAPAHIIPNQEWMDRIYGGVYDIKRIAPGLMGANHADSVTHDCTTLGGNSGSVVVNMQTGKAVALHFAGLYMIENYAVPASTIRKYLKSPPWISEGIKPPVVNIDNGGKVPTPPPSNGDHTTGRAVDAASDGAAKVNSGEVSVTIPLKITVSLGTPELGGATTSSSVTTTSDTAPPTPGSIDEAAQMLLREHRTDGIYTVWPGFEIHDGRISDTECLVVSAHPDRVAAVRQAMPRTFANYPVEVRPASIDEQMEAVGVLEAPIISVQYNDDDRTGEGFSFDWVEEEMDVLLHVGPERSWVVLSDFLRNADDELVSSMYEFHAAHIAKAIEKEA